MDEAAGSEIAIRINKEVAENEIQELVGKGTFVGDPQWVPGVRGTALDFDGVGDGVLLGNSVSRYGSTDYTLSAWVRTTADDGLIIQQRPKMEQGLDGQFNLEINEGRVRFWSYDGGYQFHFQSKDAINDGAWHHVVAQREGREGRIYVDGKPSGSAEGPIAQLDPSFEMAIGYDLRDNNRYFKGAIDEVRVYSSIVAPDEIKGAEE